MTCAGQAAEIIGPKMQPGETLLDAGCGGGYYYHSFDRRNIDVNYYGLDYTPEMIALAKQEMVKKTRLTPKHFTLGSIENLPSQQYDNVLCFNVLTNAPHYALGLSRLLDVARKRILLRESLGPQLTIRFTPDRYLDEGKRHIRVYHNTYPLEEVRSFMEEYGFVTSLITDRRTGDRMEMVVDIPHYWRIVLGERQN